MSNPAAKHKLRGMESVLLFICIAISSVFAYLYFNINLLYSYVERSFNYQLLCQGFMILGPTLVVILLDKLSLSGDVSKSVEVWVFTFITVAYAYHYLMAYRMGGQFALYFAICLLLLAEIAVYFVLYRGTMGGSNKIFALMNLAEWGAGIYLAIIINDIPYSNFDPNIIDFRGHIAILIPVYASILVAIIVTVREFANLSPKTKTT